MGSEHGDTLPASVPGEGPQNSGQSGAGEVTRAVDDWIGVRTCAPPTVGGGQSCTLLPGTWRARDTEQQGIGGTVTKQLRVGVAHTSRGPGRSPPPPSGHICHQQWVANTQHGTDWLNRKEPEDPQAPSATLQPLSHGGAERR